jgi:hypothetical protein
MTKSKRKPEFELAEVETAYDYSDYPDMDHVVRNAVGRDPDYAGTDFSTRDLGWVCETEAEVERVRRVLEGLGLRAKIRETRLRG